MDKLKNLVCSVQTYSPKNYSIILILPILTLIAGFLIWSIYLYSLGFIINDLLRTRFILTGILFIIVTYVVYSLVKILPSLLKKIIIKIYSRFIKNNNSKVLFFGFLSLIWLSIYSIILFPKIPLVFGGGQPKALALIMNEDGVKFLQSFNFGVPEGAKYQTQNICLAYEGVEDLIILRDDRIISLKKSLISGFVSLPVTNAVNEETCISYASDWAWKGFLSSLILLLSTTLQFILALLHKSIFWLT